MVFEQARSVNTQISGARAANPSKTPANRVNGLAGFEVKASWRNKWIKVLRQHRSHQKRAKGFVTAKGCSNKFVETEEVGKKRHRNLWTKGSSTTFPTRSGFDVNTQLWQDRSLVLLFVTRYCTLRAFHLEANFFAMAPGELGTFAS